jgi:DNA-directed RNA polymerase III subunit RPC11
MDTGGNRLECRTCPYQHAIDMPIFSRKNFPRKEKEDVFGGPGAWDNAQKGRVQCPTANCNGDEAAFFQVQIRSADEPMTTFYKVGLLSPFEILWRWCVLMKVIVHDVRESVEGELMGMVVGCGQLGGWDVTKHCEEFWAWVLLFLFLWRARLDNNCMHVSSLETCCSNISLSSPSANLRSPCLPVSPFAVCP